MTNITITAQKKIDLTILDNSEIQEKAQTLYKTMHDELYSRFEEIIAYLDVEPINNFSYERILKYFDPAFLFVTLTKAVEKALTSSSCFNIKENMLEELTKENISEAIMGEPMIEAFKDALNSTPIEDNYDRIQLDCLIFNLETKFLGKENPFEFNDDKNKLPPGIIEYLKDDIDD